MLAARTHTRDPLDVRLETVAVPVPGPGEVLVRVAAAGIAPGVLHLLREGRVRVLPTTLGHDIAGTVERVGTGTEAAEPGQRVVIHPNLTCGRCTYCRTDREQMCASCSMIGGAAFGPAALPLYERYHNGGLAERVIAPGWTLAGLPDTVSFEAGATIHALGVALRTLKQADLAPGSTIALTAPTGLMGAAVLKLAALFGVTRIIAVGRSSTRLAALATRAPDLLEPVALDTLGETWEEDGALTAELRRRVPDGLDAVLDFFPAGAGTVQTLAGLRPGATLVHAGGNRTPMNIPAIALSTGCWQIVGTRNCTIEDVHQVLDLLAAKAINADDLVSHRYTLDQVGEAIAAVLSRAESVLAAVVDPRQHG